MSLPEINDNASSPADRYVQLWRANQPPPDLKTFLADHPNLSARLLADVLLVDQQFRWKRGDLRCVEDYLREFPAISGHDELVIDLVYGEWRIRSSEEIPAQFNEYVTRFTHLADQLAIQLNVLDWLSQLAAESTETPELNHDTAQAAGQLPDQSYDVPSQNKNQPRSKGRRWWGLSPISRRLQLACVAGAVAASLAFVAVILWQSRSDTNTRSAVVKQGLIPNQPTSDYTVTWTLDVFQHGDVDRRHCLTTSPVPVYPGDAIRMTVKVNRAAHLYAYTIDPSGHATFLGEQSVNDATRVVEFPEQANQAIAVPPQNGTMLWVVIARDTPFATGPFIAENLRLAEPLPHLPPHTLLVDGAPLTQQRSIASDTDDGVELAEVVRRLDDRYASRSVGPSNPLTNTALDSALAAWYERLPKDLGDIHYVAISIDR